MNWPTVIQQIELATGTEFHLVAITPVTGGDINAAFYLKGRQQCYFVKLNIASLLHMFEAEFVGLQEMANTHSVAVPKPIISGLVSGQAFLVLQYIEFSSSTQTSDRLLGQQLAKLHQPVQAYYGWHRNNTIGSTLQENTKTNDWPSFWRNQRLGFQLRLAAQNGYSGRLQTLGERLANNMASLLGHSIQPSLLHGDLWGGNAAVNKNGQPVLFDPACYYGDREADLAMTELFGGFSRDFYASYQDSWPLNTGYNVRKKLYNLYHILNHLNLFGGGYSRQAENMMAELLAEIG